MGLIRFLPVFLFSLYISPPWVACYRDTGEMVIASKTLSIAHSPGYPFYIVLNKLLTLIIPFGNESYIVNISGIVFHYIATVLLSLLKSSLVAYLYGFSAILLEVATVQEPFIHGISFIVFSIFLFEKGYFMTSGFFLGLAAGFRMEALFFIPFFLFKNPKVFLRFIIFFLLAASIYIYIPVRSFSDPLLNWGTPDRFGSFIEHITRKRYGGVLDRISLGFSPGENFLDGFLFFLEILITSTFISIFTLKPEAVYFIPVFLFSIFFVFISNIPPNPHAINILKPHLIFGVIPFYFMISEKKLTHKVFIAISIFFQFFFIYSRRNQFVTGDYVSSVFRSLPVNSTVVVKEDIQLFSIWTKRFVDAARQDIKILPKGLAFSKWFKKNKIAEGVEFPEASIEELAGRCAFFGPDAELNLEPHLFLENSCRVNINDEFFILRKRHDYSYKYFFESDIMDEYNKVYLMYADFLIKKNMDAGIYLKKAMNINKILPYQYSLMGFLYIRNNDYIKARNYYIISIKRYEEYLKDAIKFKADEKTVRLIKRDYSAALTNAAYVMEKNNDVIEARNLYIKAIELNPENENAIYNLAVTYYRENQMELFRHYILELLKINPHHEARRYLR